MGRRTGDRRRTKDRKEREKERNRKRNPTKGDEAKRRLLFMIPIGAAVCNAEERGEFQRKHALRGLLHRPAAEDSEYGGLHLQDRARAGWQVWRLRLRDRRVERNSSPVDGQGKCVRYAFVCIGAADSN